MDFTAVVNEVIAITKRPDKISDIRREVNKAVNFFCIGADFAFDLEEESYAISPAAYAGNIDLTTLTRFRKFAYIRPTDRKKYVAHLTPDKVFAQGKEAVDVYYIAGTQANFKVCHEVSSFYIGYFKYPAVLTDDAPDFWLLDLSPYMVIDKAAASIFRNIGDDASATRHDKEANLAYITARADYTYGAKPL